MVRGFADGLVKDYDAVRKGLTLPWCSGAVKGNVTRIKALKRRTYGRATFGSSEDWRSSVHNDHESVSEPAFACR